MRARVDNTKTSCTLLLSYNATRECVAMAWSAMWDDVKPEAGGHSLLINRSPLECKVAMLAKKRSMARITEIIRTELAAATGGTAVATTTQIAHTADASTRGDSAAYGGVRPVETRTYINTATTLPINAEADSMFDISDNADSVLDKSKIGSGDMLNVRYPLG